MLQERTREYIRSLGDVELWEYIQAGTDRYEPAAIAFASEQFQARNLDLAQIATIVAARAKEREAEVIEAANRPLGWAARILAFLGGCFGFPALLFLVAWWLLRRDAEYRKIREMWTCAGLGLAVFIVLSIAASGRWTSELFR